MTQLIDSLSSLTKLTSYTAPVDDNISITAHDSQFNTLVSSSFNKISETSSQFKDVINALSQSEQFSSDPRSLLLLQSYIGEYSNYVSLVSTLARKGVTTIETLEKSQ